MPKLFIMRGLPGSGKSTFIKNNIPNPTICSADNFFIDELSQYNFDIKKIGLAHAQCRYKFKEAIQNGVDNIVVDNTNLTTKEYSDYIDYAFDSENNYTIYVIDLFDKLQELSFYTRNTHGVPIETLEKMRNRYTYCTDETVKLYGLHNDKVVSFDDISVQIQNNWYDVNIPRTVEFSAAIFDFTTMPNVNVKVKDFK